MQPITFSQLSPMLRYTHRMRSDQETMMFSGKEYRAYDYRLLYCVEGRVTLTIEDNAYPLEAETAIYWPSGWRYRYGQTSGVVSLLAYNFDLTDCARAKQLPIIPDQTENFSPAAQLEQLALTDAPVLNGVVLTPDFGRFLPELERLAELHTMKMRYHTEKCSGILKYLLAELAGSGLNDGARTTSGHVEEVIRYVQAHYAEPVSNEQIGQALCYHPYYLNRLMLRYTGTTLHRYLQNYRITRSIELLRSGQGTVAQVSEAVGFESVQHFSKCFRRLTGSAPSDFRR